MVTSAMIVIDMVTVQSLVSFEAKPLIKNKKIRGFPYEARVQVVNPKTFVKKMLNSKKFQNFLKIICLKNNFVKKLLALFYLES